MLRVFADRLSAVMAAHAIACDIHMAEIRRQPARRRMAVVAGIATRNVIRCFARRPESVVTRATGAEYLRVIYGKYRCE